MQKLNPSRTAETAADKIKKRGVQKVIILLF